MKIPEKEDLKVQLAKPHLILLLLISIAALVLLVISSTQAITAAGQVKLLDQSHDCVSANSNDSSCHTYEQLVLVSKNSALSFPINYTLSLQDSKKRTIAVAVDSNLYSLATTKEQVIAEIWDNQVVHLMGQTTYGDTNSSPHVTLTDKQRQTSFWAVLLVLSLSWLAFLIIRNSKEDSLANVRMFNPKQSILYEPCPTLLSAMGRLLTIVGTTILLGLIFNFDVVAISVLVVFLALPLSGLLIWRSEQTRLIIDYNGLDYRNGKKSVLVGWDEVKEILPGTFDKIAVVFIPQGKSGNLQTISLWLFKSFTTQNYDLLQQLKSRSSRAIEAQSATKMLG